MNQNETRRPQSGEAGYSPASRSEPSAPVRMPLQRRPESPATPAATELAALRRVADKLRRAGAKLPMTVTTETATTEGLIANGMSLALCVVECELDTLAGAEPRDNAAHRALFSLPPIQPSTSTDLAVPQMPAQKTVTGDSEVDAVLWLRDVISTGNADLIAKAKEAAGRVKTPLKDLEKRYTDWIHRTKPGNFGALLFSFQFSDLDGLATSSVRRAYRQQEARARFGDAIFIDTTAERFCIETLADMPLAGHYYDAEDADMMFDACHDQRPGSLADCLIEMEFWHQLYWLRDAVGGTGAGDSHAAITAREDYVFRMLSRIPPRDADEAAEVFRYLTSNDGMDRAHTGAIILNLIGAPEPYKADQGEPNE